MTHQIICGIDDRRGDDQLLADGVQSATPSRLLNQITAASEPMKKLE